MAGFTARRTTYRSRGSRTLVVTAATAALLAVPAAAWAVSAGPSELVSSNSSGQQGQTVSSQPSATADGQLVAFNSLSTNLVPGDTNGRSDVFVKDRRSGALERVSTTSSGEQGDGSAERASISADGRYVVFSVTSTNVVPGDANGGVQDVVRKDRTTGEVVLVSLLPDGSQPSTSSDTNNGVALSADGQRVTFTNGAGSSSSLRQVYVRDIPSATSQLVSRAPDGSPGDGSSFLPALSSDGQTIAFESDATNLVVDDTNGRLDIFVRDLRTGVTDRVTPADRPGFRAPTLSADGSRVAVDNRESVPNQVFVVDRADGNSLTLVSKSQDGTQGNGNSRFPAISGDGFVVAYASRATNLDPGATNTNRQNEFVTDLRSGSTALASRAVRAGEQPNSDSFSPRIAADGRTVVFNSSASNLVADDTNGANDVFATPITPDDAPAPVIPEVAAPGVLLLAGMAIGSTVMVRRSIRSATVTPVA